MRTSTFRHLLVAFVLSTTSLAATAGSAGAGGATFTNISAGAGKMSVGVSFKYAGPGPVALTVGTTADVKASKVGVASATKPNAAGVWLMSVGGLNSGTSYRFRLDSPTTSYTSPTSYKTMYRKVDVNYTKVNVIDDGDAWPRGCGDFTFVMSLNSAPYRVTYGTKCVDSGASTSITGAPYIGHWTYGNWPKSTIREEFYAFDDDTSAFSDGTNGCSNPYYFDVACGDLAGGHNNLDVTQAGTRTVYFAATPIVGTPLVYAVGTLTVSYSY